MKISYLNYIIFLFLLMKINRIDPGVNKDARLRSHFVSATSCEAFFLPHSLENTKMKFCILLASFSNNKTPLEGVLLLKRKLPTI